MTFAVRSAAQIRDAILADRRARYLLAGRDLDIQEGSDAYAEAEAYALEAEAQELGTKEAAERVLVRSATSEDLDAFAEDLGTGRSPATFARRRVAVTGTPSATLSLAGETLNAASGVRYAPIDSTGAALASVTLDVLGAATVLTQADTEGTVGNAETGTVLTWSTTPSGMGATGTVTTGSGTRSGADEETDADLQTRLLELMRERPASGNRADWRAKAMEIDGVEGAFVYPLLAPPASAPGVGTPHTPGCVTVVVVGPAQGDSTTNSRVIEGVAGAALSAHKGYVEGTHEADGDETTTGTQWRPVTIEAADYTVEAANTQAQDVVAAILLAPGSTWSWSGSALTGVSASLTQFVASGDQRAKEGKDALVFVGTSGVGSTRGGWKKVNLGTSPSYGGGNTTFTFATPLDTAPDHTKGAYPAPSVWEALRLAAFEHFDDLAPSDVDTITYPRSARFPPESWGPGYYAKLYRQILARDLMGVSGVLTAAITTPSGDVTPAQAKTIVTLGAFLAVPA